MSLLTVTTSIGRVQLPLSADGKETKEVILPKIAELDAENKETGKRFPACMVEYNMAFADKVQGVIDLYGEEAVYACLKRGFSLDAQGPISNAMKNGVAEKLGTFRNDFTSEELQEACQAGIAKANRLIEAASEGGAFRPDRLPKKTATPKVAPAATKDLLKTLLASIDPAVLAGLSEEQKALIAKMS